MRPLCRYSFLRAHSQGAPPPPPGRDRGVRLLIIPGGVGGGEAEPRWIIEHRDSSHVAEALCSHASFPLHHLSPPYPPSPLWWGCLKSSEVSHSTDLAICAFYKYCQFNQFTPNKLERLPCARPCGGHGRFPLSRRQGGPSRSEGPRGSHSLTACVLV
jgi:hypothetical protein